MNAKRAKMLRKMTSFLHQEGAFGGLPERKAYKQIKNIDKELNKDQKDIFSVNKVEATL